MSVLLGALLALALISLALLLRPLLQPAHRAPGDLRRAELEEERDLLLAGVAELQAERERGEGDPATLTREKVRLAQVLHELDSLPAAPARPQSGEGQGRSALIPGVALLLGVAAVLGVGTLILFPQWRNLGLSPREITQLDQVGRLPALRQAAETSGKAGDFRALADAAWDAAQYREAAQAYAQVLLTERDNPKALRRVGYALLDSRDQAQNGLTLIARAALLDPQSPEGQLLYGYALGLFGQYPQALEHLKAHQALAPDSREADDLIVEYQAKVGGAIDGRAVFTQNCAACHGAQGQGGTGPALAGAPALNNPAALRAIVLNGASGMPAFPQLEGKQLDALTTYLTKEAAWR